MSINDYSLIASQYALQYNTGTDYLAFREIPNIIKRLAKGNKTLDYGCGPGVSTMFLNEIGLEVEGVDICQDMLKEAKKLDIEAPFSLITSGQLPYADHTFDIVFSSFVLLEISNKPELSHVINEIYRVLKKGGLFIGITGSEELYNHKWLSLEVDFEQNKNLKSGDIAKVLLKDAGVIVYDYYWTNQDYLDVFNSSEFLLVDTLLPLGKDIDGYPWKDEKNFPPYVVYVLLK